MDINCLLLGKIWLRKAYYVVENLFWDGDFFYFPDTGTGIEHVYAPSLFHKTLAGNSHLVDSQMTDSATSAPARSSYEWVCHHEWRCGLFSNYFWQSC